MKLTQWILSVMLFAILAPSVYANRVTLDLARRAAQDVEFYLQRCGLNLVNPNAPGLPFPPFNATYAVTNRFGQALAYFTQQNVGNYGFSDWRWVNPHGSYAHRIEFSFNRIQFQTPYAGVVASANEISGPFGNGYNLYCRSFGNVQNWQFFEQCIQRDFVNVIAGQLCQYSPN